jgi:hypothetical protein
MKAIFNTIISALIEVFGKKRYLAGAVFISIFIFYVSLWLSNFSLFFAILGFDSLSVWQKLLFVFSSWEILVTNYTLFNRLVILILAILSGINFALLVYYFRKRFRLELASGASIVSVVVGFLGVGCASCGSVILSSVFGYAATAGFLGILPFRGTEFSFLGIAGLLISIYLIAKKIKAPLVC